MNFQNITLIGMPGSGKSTIGKLLEQKLGFTFVDTDVVIEQAAGKKLCEIIAEIGEEGFVKLENKTLSEYSPTATVISTGGSAVFGAEAMAHLAEISKIVYLKVDPAELENRLGDLKARGVIMYGCNGVREIYEQRHELYERYADVVVECVGTEQDCVQSLLQKLEKN